jgi:hypothetical protein
MSTSYFSLQPSFVTKDVRLRVKSHFVKYLKGRLTEQKMCTSLHMYFMVLYGSSVAFRVLFIEEVM